MPAERTQHQLFVRLSAVVSADGTQMNRRIYFVLWFFNQLLFRADNHQIPAQQQAEKRCLQFSHETKDGMIHESYYWKRELIKLSKKLADRIPYKRFWTDAQNGAFEKEVMIGFYMVRKLLESQKLPNIIASTKLDGYKYPNNGTDVHLMNNHRFPEHYNFENGKADKFELKFLINQIVHSYIFSPNFVVNEENGEMTLSAIHFCSDEHRNKWIYEISLNTIITLFDKVGNSNVTSSHYIYDKEKKDYRVNQSDENVPVPEDIEEIIRQYEANK